MRRAGPSVGRLGSRIAQVSPAQENVPERIEDRGPVRVSRFEITVSTNVPGRVTEERHWNQDTLSLMQDVAQMFYDAIEQAPDFWRQVIVFKNRRGGVHTYDNNVLSIAYGARGPKSEVGRLQRGSRVHAHKSVWIKHNSVVHLDPRRIKQLFMETPTYRQNRTGRIHGLYVHVKGGTADEDEYEDKKTVDDDEEEASPSAGGSQPHNYPNWMDEE